MSIPGLANVNFASDFSLMIRLSLVSTVPNNYSIIRIEYVLYYQISYIFSLPPFSSLFSYFLRRNSCRSGLGIDYDSGSSKLSVYYGTSRPGGVPIDMSTDQSISLTIIFPPLPHSPTPPLPHSPTPLLSLETSFTLYIYHGNKAWWDHGREFYWWIFPVFSWHSYYCFKHSCDTRYIV